MQLTRILTPGTRVVLLVEGESDRVAVETVSARAGLHLVADGVRVVPMGGATNVGHYVNRLAGAKDLLIGGLYDAGEERFFRRALDRAGIKPADSTEALAANGFFRCVKDLEDEFIRALGPDAVLNVIDAQGELGSFRTLQNQPALRDAPIEHQLRRFFGGRSGNKARYIRLLGETIAIEHVPPPLARLLVLVARTVK